MQLNSFSIKLFCAKLLRKANRVQYSIVFLLGFTLLLIIVFLALRDALSAGRANEQQIRESTLSAELSNFLLSTKEPDNSSLFESPSDYSLAAKPLSIVNQQSSFYTYLLNRANARAITAAKITWEAPRACVVEFPMQTTSDVTNTLQACFAVVPNDSNGKYVYFSLKYPTPTITRHKSGKKVSDSDQVILTLSSDRNQSIALLFEQPPLALARYPSQIDRFAGIHEVTAYTVGIPEKVIRGINAQAYEQKSLEAKGNNFVTIVGRIDSALLDSQNSSLEQWPSKAIKELKIGITVKSVMPNGKIQETIQTSAKTFGETLVSLQKSYISAITKGANLEIYRVSDGSKVLLWKSAYVNPSNAQRSTTGVQKLFDQWARFTNLTGDESDAPISVTKTHLINGPGGVLQATLTAEPVILPEVITRAFGWLTTALFLIFILALAGIYAGLRLISLGKRAWNLSRRNVALTQTKSPYGHQQDEISRLGRILHLYFNQLTRRQIKLAQRISSEAAAKSRDIRLMQAQLEIRQANLDAIGHEIRSPLQSILNKIPEDSELRVGLMRMQDGIEKIYLAASVEDGIKNREVVPSSVDLAEYLFNYTKNWREQSVNIRYDGSNHGVFVWLDPIMFETVIDHLIDNAKRYKRGKSPIKMAMMPHTDCVVVEVFNDGPKISEEALPLLFKVGASDRSTDKNRGIGLYASRVYLFGMQATISIENRINGVAVIMVFSYAKDIQLNEN